MTTPQTGDRFSLARLLADLQVIVGEDHVRAATSADQVDGAQPTLTVTPGSQEELSRVLRAASTVGARVVARGGGTKLTWGGSPEAVDVSLSTAHLNRILEHSAGDLVVTAEAGVQLTDLQAHVASAGQRLALDPPGEAATLGGIVATDASGPLRHRYGTVRDLLIGITVVLADGTVARAGGKVVKNVAGYDLAKLYTGSLGTLGIVTQVTFRLHPLPEAATTVLIELPTPDAAAGLVAVIRTSPLVPSAIELDWESGRNGGVVAVLIEGVVAGVSAQAEAAVALARPFGPARKLAADEGTSVWETMRSLPWHPGPALFGLKLAFPPAQLAQVVHAVNDTVVGQGGRAKVRGRAATGVLFVSVSDVSLEKQIHIVTTLRSILTRARGSLVVLHASPEVKAAVDVWGSVGNSLPLMQRVKHQFDPERILSPGRFVGGI